MLAPKVQDALTKIEDVLLEGSTESYILWNILTALRGPDNGNRAVKMTTTVLVRRAAFPRLARGVDMQAGYYCGAVFCAPTQRDFEQAQEADQMTHFRTHVTIAMDALGIDRPVCALAKKNDAERLGPPKA